VTKHFYILFCFFFLVCSKSFSQDDLKGIVVATDTIRTEINTLGPSKAAFYSAILPGLGQAYNKKYWKIPIVYIAIGTGIYAYSWNLKLYNNYRNAYKERLLVGDDNTTDRYKGIVPTPRLIDAQKFYQRNRDISLLVTVALYALNVIDANVDAHLLQFNVNEKLTLKPDIYQNNINNKQNIGFALNYTF
jgi:hypothetical protein